jgi:myosin heavy subunit
MNSKLFLPTELSEISNNLVIFDCTRLFGEVFGEFCDHKMREIEGQDWLNQIRDQRRIYRINLSDTAFLLKECLASDSLIRKVLPKSESFYNKLDILKKLRNENQHFNLKAGTQEIKAAVELYFGVCLDLNLQFGVNEYSILLKRLDDLQAGKNFSIDPILSQTLSEMERHKAEMEDQLIEKNVLLLDKENKLKHVREVILESNLKIDDLTKSNEQKTSAFNKIIDDLEKSKMEAEELRAQLSELSAQKVSDEITEKEIEKLIASLAENLSKANEDSPKKLANKIPRKNLSSEVGSIWNKPKGKRKITLSVAKRDLVDSRSSEPIDYIPEESRIEMAEEWLLVRPSGGRVFVDDEGNASTLLGESLVFLGNIQRYFD